MGFSGVGNLWKDIKAGGCIPFPHQVVALRLMLTEGYSSRPKERAREVEGQAVRIEEPCQKATRALSSSDSEDEMVDQRAILGFFGFFCIQFYFIFKKYNTKNSKSV